MCYKEKRQWIEVILLANNIFERKLFDETVLWYLVVGFGEHNRTIWGKSYFNIIELTLGKAETFKDYFLSQHLIMNEIGVLETRRKKM